MERADGKAAGERRLYTCEGGHGAATPYAAIHRNNFYLT
jgi:hypothetical protein